MPNKQVIIQSSIEAVEIIDTPIPTPGDKDVVIKVVVAGTNPKDWKYPLWYVTSPILTSLPFLNIPIGKTSLTTVAMTWQVSSTR